MVAIDKTTWMPDSLTAEEKAEFVSEATTTRIDPSTGEEVDQVDYHRAAGLAWEHYATLGAGADGQTSPRVGSMTTGDQTITYTDGGTRQAAALRRASYHYARSRPYTARLGGTVQMEPLPARYVQAVEPDDEVA